MTYLDCTVAGCLYNADKCCCKGDITVEGNHATNTQETCCGSFRERGTHGGQNTAGRMSKEIEVACEACNCIYNEEHRCAAEHIGIAGAHACTCGETECASFKSR